LKAYLKEFWTDKRVMFINLMFIIYSCSALFTPYEPWSWTAVIGGVVFFFFLEYFVHRFVLHGFFAKIMPKAHVGHDAHHNDPLNMTFLLTPNQYNVPYHFLLWVVFSLAFWSFHLGSSVMAGFAAYHLYYEWSHFVSHRPIQPITPWGKWMKKFHLLHHYKNDKHWFGVTHPVLDSVFGTDPSQDEIEKTVTTPVKKDSKQGNAN